MWRRVTKAAAAAAWVTAAAVIAAGCDTPAAPAPASRVSAPPAGSLSSPACSTATDTAPALAGVRTAMSPAKGSPFGVAATPDGQWAFLAVDSGVEVLRTGRSLAPRLVRTIPLTGSPAGVTVTPDGRYLLAAVGAGAAVISVARAERGTAGALLGLLSAPGGGMNHSAIEVAVSPDGQFAFVSLEYASQVAVFSLGAALRSGFSAARYVGSIPLGRAVVGLAVSPDGRWLYVTSEIGMHGHTNGQGTLSVIDLRRAETKPAASVTATVSAGCQPVRVITAAGGSQVWVTARASDDLLCFSAARLASDPAHALTAVVRVGEAPVGLAAVRGGALIVVADSDRFNARGATASLDVVNVAAALSGRPAVTGHVRSGSFPRETTLLPDGTLLVSNYGSSQLEAVAVASIPAS